MILSRARTWMQLAGTILSNSYLGTLFTRTVNTGLTKGACVPFLNCYACPTALFSCPVGTLQHFMAIQVVPFYLLSFIALIGLTIGRMGCGWVCPFGFVQDLMYKIKSRKYEIPSRYKYVKYLVLLVLVIVIPYKTGEMWFSKLCPAGTLFAGIPWAIWNPVQSKTGLHVLPDGPGVLFYVALFILMMFLIWFVISKRPFCRLFCPMGALLALFSRFSMVRLELGDGCDGCNKCSDICPMELDVTVEYNSEECIRCLECTKCGYVNLKTMFPKFSKEPEKCMKKQ